MSMSEVSSDIVRASDKRESTERLVIMHPVASGDNFTTVLKSSHRLKEDIPSLVPCCEGRELQINEEFLHSGLSAISVKHDSVLDCLSVTRTSENADFVLTNPPSIGGVVRHRNSFRSLHRPDLRRVPCLRKMAPQELESLFRGSAVPVPKPDSSVTPPDVAPEPQGEECVRVMLPTQDETPPKLQKSRGETADGRLNGGGAECAVTGTLQPAKESATAARACDASGSTVSAELPSGMRLHGARARLYTSVLGAGHARAPGDQLDAISATNSELDEWTEQALPVDAALTSEELQIILPPRRDDQLPADPSATNSIC